MAPGLENEINGRGNPLRGPHDTLYPQKVALTSPKIGGRSVGIIRLWTEAVEFSLVRVQKYPNVTTSFTWLQHASASLHEGGYTISQGHL
jgi:hypothetical protein